MAIHHLVSRGVQIAQQHADKAGDAQKWSDLSITAIVVLSLTLFGYAIFNTAIHYTYGLFIPNLIMTEAPTTTTVVRTATYHDDLDGNENPDASLLTKEEKEFMQPRDEEVLVITEKPVTARSCTIISHLKEKTGDSSIRFHGFGGYWLQSTMVLMVKSFVGFLVPQAQTIMLVPINAAFCLFTAAWVQQTVAVPGKNYFQRVGELRRNGGFGKLFLPTLLVEAVQLSVASLPRNIMVATSALVEVKGDGSGKYELVITTVGAALAVLTLLLSFTCVVIPLHIGLTRFQASLLPEDADTLISIDRTLGNAEVRGIRAAWKSFSRDALVRLIKAYAKVILMQVTLAVAAVAIFAVELKVFAGPQFDHLLDSGKQMYHH